FGEAADVNVTSGAQDVFAQSVKGDVAVNKFGSFNVSKDAVANMYFHRQNESNEASKLFNFVDNRININGTVNAIHNAKVGGDLYFLSKQGMIVGASGAINAGSLTVLTPTEKWWNDHAVEVAPDKVNVNDISNLKVPINASGTITVLGNINAVNSVKLKAATINVGVEGTGANKTYHKANIKTGVVDFTNLVKMTDEQLVAAGIGEENNVAAGLVLNKTTDGKIVLAAESTSNASWGVSDTANLTATVNVAGGSQIIADGVADGAGNKNNAVSITAMATHNAGVVEFTKDGEKYYKVGGYDAPLSENEYTKLFPGGAQTVFYTNVNTKAEVNITNEGATDGAKTTIKGERVDIEALAANALETSKYLPSNIKNIEKLAASIAFQGVDVSVGMLENTANVNLGANTIVKAEGADVNIQAKADETLEMGSNVFGLNALSLIYPNASLAVPGVAMNFGVAHNKAQVTLGGSVEADHGSVNVEALAKQVFHSSATTALPLDVLPAEGFINFAFNNMKGSNISRVQVLEGAAITADNKNSTDRQNVNLRAEAQNDVKIIGNASMGDKGAVAVGVSVVDYDSEATVNVDGTVHAKNELRAEAESRYSQNEIIMNNSAGTGFLWNMLRAPLLESHTIGNIGQGIAGLLEIFHADIMNQNNSAFQDAGSFLKLGISVNKVNESNKAHVNVGEKGTLVASAADSAVTIGAQSLLEGNHVSVVGASNNYKSPKDTSTKVLVNGGILLSDFDNDANVIIKGDANIKGDKISGGNVNIYSKAEAKFDRLPKMVDKFKGYTQSIDSIIKEGNPSADTVYLYNKYNALVAEYIAFMEHCDDMQEVAKKQQEFADNKYVVAYNSLITTGRASYEDDNKGNRSASITNTQKQKIEMAAPGIMDMTKVLISFINPESYVSYHAGVSTNGQTSPEAYAAVGVSGSYAKTNLNNTSKVLVGNDVTIHGQNDVKLTTTAESGEVSFDGKLGLLRGGQSFSGGIAVGVHDLNTANIISVGEKTSIVTGKTIDFDARLKSKHVGIASGMGFSKNNEWIGNVELLDVNSNNLIAIDDEATLNATTLRLNGVNDSSVVNVTGGFAMANKSGVGLAVGINDIKRNNLVAVTDTDGVQALKDTTIITEANKKKGQQVDDEETRLRKLLAANVKSEKEKLFGTKALEEIAGAISANAIVGDAHTEGLMVLLSADVGLVMPGDNENPGLGSRFSTWLGNRKDDIKDQLKIFDDFIASAINAQTEVWEGIGIRKEAVNPDAGKAMPTFTLNGSGSISLADLDGATATVINSNIAGNKKLNINMKDANSKIKLHASDDSCFVNLSGGVVFGMPAYLQQPEGFSSTALSLTGGVAYNNSNTSVYSAIENSAIENVDEISNTATREGAISAIAAAVDLVIKYGQMAPTGLGLAGGVSIDVGKASTKAVLANNNVNTAGNNTKHAVVQNIATTKDVEVTGAIELDVSSGNNKNIGIGAAVTRGYLKNAVEAVVDGGTYKNLSGLTNEAVTDMTQVDAVIGGGVSKNTGTGANVAVQGAVAYNAIDNYINAKVANAVIDTETLEVMAYDTKLGGSPNKYAKMLQDKYHIDTDGAGFIDLAKQNAELKEIGEHGGSVVTAGLQFTGANATHDSLGLTVAGTVVANNINNNYNALVDGVTLNKGVNIKSGKQPITAKVMAESSTLVTDVAAGISIETGELSFQGAGSVANNYVSGG
ncbi:MAG: leukotoxin LktA family filamentous adhesin, partial [Phascolarctobacterium sp.]|nr:leukotoxin LktA family filamentous adhesin [Phascolarctobacterium sp.]